MLANDKFVVGCDFDQSLRGDGIETSSTRISVVDSNHGKMIVNTCPDTVVSAEGPLIDL